MKFTKYYNFQKTLNFVVLLRLHGVVMLFIYFLIRDPIVNCKQLGNEQNIQLKARAEQT